MVAGMPRAGVPGGCETIRASLALSCVPSCLATVFRDGTEELYIHQISLARRIGTIFGYIPFVFHWRRDHHGVRLSRFEMEMIL